MTDEKPLTLEESKALQAENERLLQNYRWHMNGNNGWRKLLQTEIRQQQQSSVNFYC